MDNDVVIVGAGAAGLAAALSLAERSIRVTVVEARERVGGRVLTRAIGSSDELAEMGAEFIHGDAPETSDFLREAGLAKIETDDTTFACDANGRLHAVDDDFGSNDIFEGVRALARDESVDAFLRRFDGDPHMRESARLAREFVEGFEAADTTLASARAIADEIRSGIDATSSRPVGSYAPLFAHLIARCTRAGVTVRFGLPIERIEWTRGNVSLVTSGSAERIRARGAIVTVPIGVLQQRRGATPFAFVPPLPQATRAAIDGIEMGHVVRVALAFAQPFWERLAGGRYRDAAFFRCATGSFDAFWTQVPARSRVVVAWAGGPRAIELDGIATNDRIERARDEFGDLFGERERARREFEDGATHDWSGDPFACGAYSYITTGAGSARETLAAPIEETLFFAGEATSTTGQGGTVSGAFESGLRAAREALRTLPR